MPKPMQVDICLCTFKRPRLLKETLSSIERQILPSDITMRVFVVDNDAAASGKSMVSEFIERGIIDVSYDVEPEQNIARARNRSVKAGHGDFIAFIDDDEVAADNWLGELCDCLRRFDADAVFGPVLPIYPATAPDWVIEAGVVDRPAYETGTRVFSGATGNTLVKRSLLQSYDGPFDPAFGLTGGSDSAFFRKTAKNGAKLIWCNEAIVEEDVPEERMTLGFLRRRAYRGGQSFARFFLTDATRFAKVKWFCKRIVYTAAIILIIPVATMLGTKRFIWAIRKLFLNIGQLSVVTGRYFHEYRGG